MTRLHVASRGPIVLQIQQDWVGPDAHHVGIRKTVAYFAKGHRLVKRQDDFSCSTCEGHGTVPRQHRGPTAFDRCHMCSGKGFTRTTGKWVIAERFKSISAAEARALQKRLEGEGWSILVAAPECLSFGGAMADAALRGGCVVISHSDGSDIEVADSE